MIAIPNFSPKDGLYQIDHGRIHKYKGKGGTVRVYDLIEIDDTVWENESHKLIRMTEEQRVNKELAEMVTCGECKHWDKEEHDCNIRDSYGWNYKPTDFCSYGEGEPMEIYSGHEGKDRVCCNCEHNKRMPKSTYVRCICDMDGHYIGYIECFDCWCRHWAKMEG